MLIWLRENKRSVAKWFVWPLIFVFILLYGYSGVQTQMALDERTAVSVNGVRVSMAKFQAIDEEVSRFYSNTLVEPEKPRALVALEQTIERELARQLADDLGLRTEDARVNETIGNQMSQGTGVVNEQIYRYFLQESGFGSHENYREFLRAQMNVQLALDTIRSTALPGREELERAIRSQKETRSVEMLAFPSSDYLGEVDATTDELKAYFEEHKDRYYFPKRMSIEYLSFRPENFISEATPEEEDLIRWFSDNEDQFLMPAERTVQSVVFSAGAFREQVQVTEEDLRQYFETKKSQYREPDRFKTQFVTVSVEVPDASIEAVMNERPQEFVSQEEAVAARHILLKTEPGAGPAELARVKSQLDEIRARISTEEDFMREAKAYSTDTSNSGKGGDLGYFSKGRMVPEFESAAFILPEATVSQPVKTMFGYHLIWVYAHRDAGERMSVDEARFQVLREIDTQPIRDRARAQLEAIKAQMAGRSMTDASVTLDLPVHQTDWFARGDNPHELAARDKFPFYQAVSTLEPGQVTDIVEGFSAFYLIEVVDKQASRDQTFEEVRDKVENAYRTEKAGELARTKAQEAADSIRSGSLTFDQVASAYSLPEAATYSGLRNPSGTQLPENRVVDREIINRAFTIEEGAVEGPFDTLQGPTLIKLVKEEAERFPELEEVREEAEAAFRQVVAREIAHEKAWDVWYSLDESGDDLGKSAGQHGFQTIVSEPFSPGEIVPGFASDSVVNFVAAGLRVAGATSPVVEDPPQEGENPQPVKAYFLLQAEMVEDPRMPAFEEVEEDVRNDLLLEKAAEIAKTNAEEASQQIAGLLAQATAPLSASRALDLQAFANQNGLTYRPPNAMSFGVNSPAIAGQNSAAPITSTVFQMSVGQVSKPVPAIEVVPEGDTAAQRVHGYYIAQLVGVSAPPTGGASRGEVFRTLATRLQDAVQTDWAERAREKAEIEPNQDAFAEEIIEMLDTDKSSS
jgi:parvulin-like peptidyl-prolyl isomerase